MHMGASDQAVADADKVLAIEKRINDKAEGNAPVVNGVRKFKRPPLNFRALLLKAEALFLAGKFEYAMVYFHQVCRLRFSFHPPSSCPVTGGGCYFLPQTRPESRDRW